MENVRRFLERHGLPGLPPEELVPLGSVPDPQIGHGIGATTAAADLASLAADASAWQRVAHPRFEREGYAVFRAIDRPSALLLHSDHGPLEPVGRVDDRCLAVDADVVVDLEGFAPDECFAAVHAGGRMGGLVLLSDRIGVLPRPLEVPLPAVVRSPARELAAALEDGWVRDEVERLCDVGGPLSEASAMGLLARYRPLPATREARSALLASVLSGGPAPSLRGERRWAGQLTPAESDAIEREASARAASLFHELEMLGETPDPESAAWRAGWLRILHGRDTLEGVRVLLAIAREAPRLAAALRLLDRAGTLAARALPRSHEVARDERLIDASVRSPEGWWTWPAHPEVELEREVDFEAEAE